jgi:hypothetical protein
MKPRSCAASADTCKTLIGNVTVINAVCARDCYLVDLWSMRFLRQASAWSEDRLHLTSDSHRRVALRASEVLGIPVTENWRTCQDDVSQDGAAADGSPLAAVLSGAVASGTGGNLPGGPVGAPVVAATRQVPTPQPIRFPRPIRPPTDRMDFPGSAI